MSRVDDLIRLMSRRPLVMGIVNLTPDSFFDGGQLFRDGRLDLARLCERVEALVAEGADLLDVGGESTRPGAVPVAVTEELDRVVPAVEALAHRFDVAISVDTSAPEVMAAVARAGATMINDVRALRRPGALEVVARTGVMACLMHAGGEPATMQQCVAYTDVVAEVSRFLRDRVAACVEAGIARNRLLLDPGFGFGKHLEHNLALFRSLPEFGSLGLPLLVGLSRKSLIGALLNRPLDQRLVGSVVLALLAAQAGARVLRVHDVAATVDALKLMRLTQRSERV